MTKSYHLTQEQVREIRDDLINTSIINSNTSALEDATNIINAVLDKVLGEPIYQIHNHIDDVWWDAQKDMFDREKTRDKRMLYAPKEQP